MRLIPYTFQPEGDSIEIVGVSDLHAGSTNFLPKKAEAHRKYILASPDRKVIDMGDSVENALHSSPGSSMFQQTCPPREQRLWVKEYYRPMRDRMLGVVASNHPDRSDREVDWTPDESLVDFLGCPHIRWEAVLSITVGDSRRGQNYLIFVRHVMSNSSKPGVILNSMVMKARAIQACDVYWGAHCHQYLYEPLPAQIPDPRHNRIRYMEQHFCMGDSFMSYDASYAEAHGYPYPTPGQVSLVLHKDQHLVEVKRLLY